MAGEIAFSDKGTMLYCKGGSTYTELVGIKSAPASGAEPANIDVTELKSDKNQYIPDRVDSPNQTFLYNYTGENHNKVLAICDGTAKEFLVVFQDGAGTYIKGVASCFTNEISKGSAIEGTLTVVPEDIQYKTSAQVSSLIPALSI